MSIYFKSFIRSACIKACATCVHTAGSSIVCCVLSFLLISPALAQFQVFTLQDAATQPLIRHSTKNARIQADPLILPFFDDFSTSFGKPDTLLWEKEGGVAVNNTAAVNPPSKGVATLDGLRITGSPYDFSSILSQAPTDVLTSRPINLSGLEAANVYLSFFWQAQGLGELPDVTDSLVLQFKTAGDNPTWQTAQTIRGQALADFKQEIIPVGAQYCFATFQFRFQVFGRPSGSYDAWQIDYVYLNKGRHANDRTIRDVTVVNQPASLLKNYTAMPIEQLLADPTQLRDSVYTSITNLHNRGIFTTYSFKIQNMMNGQTLSQADFLNPLPVNPMEKQLKGVKLNSSSLLPAGKDSLILKYTFTVNTGDDNLTVPPIDLRKNDTISGTTVLSTYFAYDDGTAEYGLGIRQRQGRAACKFFLNTPDTLTAVRIYFTRIEKDLTGQAFVLRIWNKLDNNRESVLYEESLPIQYEDTLNEFVEFQLKSPIIITDTFYVGWQQNTDDILAVGLDKNTDAGGQLYFNITGTGTWEHNTEIKGSPMIRPVFKTLVAGVDTVGIEEDPEIKAFAVYPNPTNGVLVWRENGVSAIEVYDLLGRKVKSKFYQPSDSQTLDLATMHSGIYVLYINFRNRIAIRKVILNRQN